MSEDHSIRTFGDHVLHFAQSAGAITQTDLREILESVKSYLIAALDATFFAIVTPKINNSEPWLLGEWPVSNWWSKPLKQDGMYTCQVGLAYGLGRRLWIVGSDQRELHRTASYEDLLGNVTSNMIPKYAQIEGVVSRTSIILPLVLNSDVEHLGIMNVECADYMSVVTNWQVELQKIARAIAILRHLTHTRDLQDSSITEAKRRLGDADFVPVVRKRKVFLASSSRADGEVVRVLDQILTDTFHEPADELVRWNEPAEGSIRERIWGSLSTCTFAACYFSEPAKAGSMRRFIDNPNVLFEVGILYALKRSRRSPVRGLLLLREENSPSIPFDLGDERMLKVPRLQDGKLDEKSFKIMLSDYLSHMLDAD